MVREAGHRDGLVAAGQRQAEHAGGELGVVVEQLVEVAHAEQQEHAGMAFLGLPVLLHHRSGHAESVVRVVRCQVVSDAVDRLGH